MCFLKLNFDRFFFFPQWVCDLEMLGNERHAGIDWGDMSALDLALVARPEMTVACLTICHTCHSHAHACLCGEWAVIFIYALDSGYFPFRF